MVIEGPDLGRPIVDTLYGSRHSNMKELRFNAEGGVWRFAFAFDPKQRAVILVGVTSKVQTKNNSIAGCWLLDVADERFDDYAQKERDK